MSNNPRRPILYNGEVYSVPVEKGSAGGSKDYPLTYGEARERVLSDISTTKESLRHLSPDLRLPNEVILCIRMQPEFTAKSYYPDSLFDTNTVKFGLEEVGSRIWKSDEPMAVKDDEKKVTTKSGKLFFVRTTERGLSRLEQELSKPEISLTKKFTTDIQKISSIDMLTESERVLGIKEGWKGGRLEAVLHPFSLDREVAIEHFLNILEEAGADRSTVKYKQYSGGVTFISFYGNNRVLEAMRGYNPLRTVHPLQMRELPNISRGQAVPGGPLPPVFKQKSSVVVGVIDGGAVSGNPYLDNYIEIEDSVTGPAHPDYIEHGMQVSGAVLYGPLNKYTSKDVLPEPSVSVKSFRVLSSTTSDPDLYDVIDAIEEIVPANRNISVYNLSLGPCGPILDDSISRFTFACDLLSKEYGVLFCVAVGNDGEVEGYNRIQSPSDMVNGLAIGAYTKLNGIVERAPYSCIGPGREGNKMKPDLLAFGGCGQHPIHLIAPTAGQRVWNAGTSFASPIASGAAGRLIGESNNVINSLIARTLLVHSSIDLDTIGHSLDLGHGILPESLEEVVTCIDKSYTLIYRGEIEPGKYAEFNIPWVNEIVEGKATFHWTVAVLTDVDPQSPDDYTSSAVETVFYANRYKFLFKKEGKTKVVDIDADPQKARELIADGWVKQSGFPVSDSGSMRYQNEDELRKDLKWDSLDTRIIKKKSKNVKDPLFHIHAIGRGSRVNQTKVKFAVIFTVIAPSATVDLYSKILNTYSALIPLNMNVQANVQVNIAS